MYNNTYLQTAFNTLTNKVALHVKDEESKTKIESFKTGNFIVKIFEY